MLAKDTSPHTVWSRPSRLVTRMRLSGSAMHLQTSTTNLPSLSTCPKNHAVEWLLEILLTSIHLQCCPSTGGVPYCDTELLCGIRCVSSFQATRAISFVATTGWIRDDRGLPKWRAYPATHYPSWRGTARTASSETGRNTTTSSARRIRRQVWAVSHQNRTSGHR
jgi:hypothetical protein